MDDSDLDGHLEHEVPVGNPSPEQELSATIQFVETATDQYDEGGLVDLRVKDRVFRVSRNRLTLRSPFFRKAFTLPQEGNAKPPVIIEIELHNDPVEFANFLWYLHADPLSAYEFEQLRPSEKKCSTLLGIASVAHMYEALDVARWAMTTVLRLLKTHARGFTIGDAFAKHLLRTAARFQEDADASYLADARDIVCDAMSVDGPGPMAKDPILAVLVAQDIEDNYLLAHAYFYTLRKGDAYCQRDARLRALDRQRLLSGGYALAQRSIILGNPSWARPGSPGGVFYESGLCSHGHFHVAIPPWVPAVHGEIASIREELWQMFDNTAWRLTE